MQIRQVILSTLLFYTVLAQANDIKPDSVIKHTMNKGIDMVQIEEYQRANDIFMQCLNMGTLLPDELAFYFGKSLFNTGHPVQSGMFLEKYVQLKDSTAANYAEALAMLEALNDTPEMVNDEVILDPETETIPAEEDPCQGYEDVICPICDGAGVVKKNGKFGPIFRTCKYCDDHGLMSCEDYKKYREGTLENE